MVCNCGRQVKFSSEEGKWVHLVDCDHEVSFGTKDIPVDPDISIGVGTFDFEEVVEENPAYGQVTRGERRMMILTTEVKGIPWWQIVKHERGDYCHCPQHAPNCQVCEVFNATT